MTINEKANKEITKACASLHKALDSLENSPAYINADDIFHTSTVRQANQIIEAITMLIQL